MQVPVGFVFPIIDFLLLSVSQPYASLCKLGQLYCKVMQAGTRPMQWLASYTDTYSKSNHIITLLFYTVHAYMKLHVR